MKLSKDYSDKEKSIFKGIMDLLNQGYMIHDMKVADIAAAAGMGKSTVYEYFATKEEIIRQALGYYLYKEYKDLTALITDDCSFTDILSKIMDYTVDLLASRFSSLLFMVLDLRQSDIKQIICDDSNLLIEVRSGINDQIARMFALGKKEKLIGESVTVEDCGLVLSGIISAFTNEVIFMRNKSLFHKGVEHSKELIGEEEQLKNDKYLNALKERAIRLILKALG